MYDTNQGIKKRESMRGMCSIGRPNAATTWPGVNNGALRHCEHKAIDKKRTIDPLLPWEE